MLVPASFPDPLPSRALLAVGVAGHPVCLSCLLAYQYAIPCGLCVPRARSGRPSGPRRVPFACVCACAPAAFAPPPPLRLVWGTHHAQFRGRAPVGLFQAVHAPPRLLPQSRALSS